MTLAELRTKANAKLTPFWAMLIEKQPLYFLKHGKFFQLIVTSQVVDGIDTAWNMVHPADEQHVIDVDFPWSDVIPFQISVDEWAGEDRGFSVTNPGEPPTGGEVIPFHVTVDEWAREDIGFSATATVELPNGDKYRRTRKATAVLTDEVWDYTDPLHPVLITPKSVSSFVEEDTNWQLVVVSPF